MSRPPKELERVVAFTAIKLYAVHSHLYYKMDEPIISDQEYDALCAWLLANYEWVKPHDLNGYLDKNSLRAGTGFQLNVTGCTLDAAYALRYLNRVMKNAPAKTLTEDCDDLC